MFERRSSSPQTRFRQILPWLWIIGPAYLVALAIALLAEPGTEGGREMFDRIFAAN